MINESVPLRDSFPDYVIPTESIDFRDRLSALSDDNRLLVPFTRVSDNRLHLLQAVITNPPATLLTQGFDSVRTTILDIDIDIDAANLLSNGLLMQPVAGGFLIFVNSIESARVYRLGYTGAVEEVWSTPIEQFFVFQGRLYASRRNGSTIELLSVTDDGRQWRTAFTIPNSVNQSYWFYPTVNDLFVNNVSGDQLFVTTQFDRDGIQLEALDFRELEGRTVTDVEVFGEDIYLSTMSGVFRRGYAEFVESRQE